MIKVVFGAWTWGFFFLLLLETTAQTKPQITIVRSRGQTKTPDKQGIIALTALENDLLIEWKSCVGCTYRYKLAGVNQDIVVYEYPMASFTNLKGGEFLFWVQTQQNGRWSKPAQLIFKVETSLVESSWFWPSVVFYALLLIGAGIYFFLLYNFRQKLKLHSLRNRIAADLHDEVGATLSSIAISTRLVERKLGQHVPEALSLLQQIKTDSEDTIQSIRDTVWTLNPDNDSLPQLLEKMRSMAFQLLTPQDIALDFKNDIAADTILKISMEQRRNLYLIFKEALNNTLKYAQATKVSFEFRVLSSELKMTITDNGKGFDTAQRHEGNGLKNYQKRAKESMMEVTLTSKIGEGTKIEVTVMPS